MLVSTLISPSEKTLPARLNMDIIESLQFRIAPAIFTPRCVYDGRKNIFAVRELPFGERGYQDFDVTLGDGRPDPNGRPPKVYKVRLTKVAEINPEHVSFTRPLNYLFNILNRVLKRFIHGEQSHDNSVLTAITALNVVIRMAPTMAYPFNVRSFFTSRETRDIGSGISLWRGYFQSVRPGIGQMLINIDISTATMYKGGPLLVVCCEYLGKTNPNFLAQHTLSERERYRLHKFIQGVRVVTNQPIGAHPAAGGRNEPTPRVVKGLSIKSARMEYFTLRDGRSLSVADYFKQTMNRPLQFPDCLCVEVGSGAKIPMELCNIPPGQILRKQIPPDKTKDVLDFATKRPADRLASIRTGLSVLAYGQSEYVRQFGMRVDESGPLKVQARVLKPPILRYGVGSKAPTITPNNGAWNIPVGPIVAWGMVVFEHRFKEQQIQDVAEGLYNGCAKVGIRLEEMVVCKFASGQQQVRKTLMEAGKEIYAKLKVAPSLLVVILPEGANDMYTEVKYFGDVEMGCATQCLKSLKCTRAKPQYFANVCLKINVKLGGINTIPDPSSVSVLTDPHMPTIVMGADVIHPSPGSVGRPSFTSLVGNVDSDTAKYVADSRVQTSRQEMIADLCEMSKHVLGFYTRYRASVEKKLGTTCNPKRIIFYRDGVSEGQFKQVLDIELPQLKAACAEMKIDAKITIIVVGKRHHVRFFPIDGGDRTGNCLAGTVVDREIAHPTEFDFYLQSHGGLLGTSRPAHYSFAGPLRREFIVEDIPT
uniref:Argonaute-like protein n=1 Tax=Psilocybe cubensis TaxID=181762 RepID=A0A8H8CLR0_PSICU